MWQLVLISLFSIAIIAESKEDWSYNNTKLWSRRHRYCGGKVQSPIDLQFDISHYNSRLKQVSLEEQSSPEPVDLFNNGHAAQISLKNRYVVKNIAPEAEDYRVEQVHFHWGHSNDNIRGSEHLYEGQSYPLEMHVVSYSSWFPSISAAMTNTRALAVIGVFFELSDEPNPLLQPLVDALQHIRGQDQHTTISNEFDLKALIGEERLRRYYRYDGSLTTPPCFESVIWTVLSEPLKLSLPQLHAFRYLHDHHAKIIKNTYRPVQPLGTRILFRSFLSKDIDKDLEERTIVADNHGQDLTSSLKLMAILISLLIIIF